MKITSKIQQLLVVVLLLQSAITRKSYYLKNSKGDETPRVRAFDDSYCLKDNGKDSVCFDHATDLEVGYEWE